MHSESLLDRLAVPVISAPMAGVAGGRLAAAVSAAGALGTVGVGYAATPEWIDQELTAAAAAHHPFGVGFILWVLESNPGWLDAALAHQPALVSLGFGDPVPWVGRVQAGGSLAALQVGTLDEAHRAIDAGADILVARGSEGGGHGRGEVATLPLLQEVVSATDRPVVAAGGVASAAGLAAVAAAGASGAWVGTPFVACAESDAKETARQAIIEAGSDDTVYTRAFDIAQGHSWPPEYGGRALHNRFTETWVGRESELEAAAATSDEIRQTVLAARRDGDVAVAPVYAGQSAGLITATRTAAEVVQELAGYRALLAEAAARHPVTPSDAG